VIMKKIAGLGLVLLGGLAAAHGGSTGQAWETLVGLFAVVIGGVLLAMKIVRRNTSLPARPATD
jgi:hypothetical protein